MIIGRTPLEQAIEFTIGALALTAALSALLLCTDAWSTSWQIGIAISVMFGPVFLGVFALAMYFCGDALFGGGE